MIRLVNMPFLSISRPMLSLASFKARLAAAGHPSRIHNFNLDFARMIGLGAYETIAMFKGIETPLGEWLFARSAWGGPFGPSEEEFLAICGEELKVIPHIKDPGAWLRKVRDEVIPMYLRRCVAQLLADGTPRVIAFSCMFFQTLPSLALGRMLRQELPGVKLVYGGACFHDEMGEELIAKAPWIDAVSLGEADDVVVPLFAAMLAGQPPAGLQGILYRDQDGAVQAGPPITPVSREVLNDAPTPDFSDFFADAKRLGIADVEGYKERLLIPFESSRGCWWGQKHHCTFCGLNGHGMEYRARDADRVYDEIKTLSTRHPGAILQASDNILAMSYFHDLLPRLRDDPPAPDLELFYECKANLDRAQIAAMAAAHIKYVQPGIESLSTHLLQLMRKGVTALQNVFFLRCCREHNVEVFWNLLIRIPGEHAEDYAQMAAWIPKLTHLRPPYGGAPMVEVHRFSPYFFDRDRYTSELRPRPWYAGLYPADRVDLHRVAYYFDATWKDTLPVSAHDEVVKATLEWIRVWRESPALPRLVQRLVEGGVAIEDTRFGRTSESLLGPIEALVYRAIDTPTRLQVLPRKLAGTAAGGIKPGELQALLDGLVERDLALTENESYLALAFTDDPPEDPVWVRASRLRRITNQDPALRILAST